MGSQCRIVAPSPRLAELGRSLVDDLERCWTRFTLDSELARMNAHAGRVCLVSAELHAVLRTAETARRLSGGRFDVRCLDAVERAGYTTSWHGPAADGDADGRGHPCGRRATGEVSPLASWDGPIELVDDPPAVVLPPGCRIDLGGIGKGYAADLVADALRAAGADRVQVELGGDVRVSGPPWHGSAWTVEVEDPHDRRRTAAVVELPEGAVATSSVLRRRWVRDGVATHHLIDVRTMRPAETDLVAVTAIASLTWRAEVAAKCALMAGRDGAAEALAPFGARGLLFGRDGTIEEVG
jgi:thiamine biosynthesis lipoprotein